MTQSTTDDTEPFNDALLVGLTAADLDNDPFYKVPIAYGVGQNRHDKNWGNMNSTRGKLARAISEYVYGDKDGKCITQGPLVAGQRIAKNMQSAHFIMLDCDTGEDMDSLERKVRDKGWAAIMWNTYSHMKPVTEIPEDRIVKHAREMRGTLTDEGLSIVVRDYLKSKRYQDSVLDGIVSIDKQHVDGGVKYIVHHAPMPRARVLIWLDEPYMFATAKGTHAEGIQDWKSLYSGVAELLGVDYDQSCTDPSRLMYTPRIPAPTSDTDATPYDRGYDIRVIAGEALDIDAVPRINSRSKIHQTASTPLQAFSNAVNAQSNHDHTIPRWLLKFAAKHGDDLELVELMGSVEDALSNTGDKAEFVCPNEDRHTEQKADDRAFAVWNASGREGGFDARCQHATCKEDSHGDRLWWLWKLCEKYDWSEDDLLQFCPNAVAEEAVQIERQTQEADAIEVILAGLTERGEHATSSEIEHFLERVGHIPSAVRRDELVSAVAKACKRSKKPLADELKRIMDAQLEAISEQQIVAALVRPPKDKKDAAIIYSHWQQPEQNECAFARFEHMNLKTPTLFRRTDGTVVLVLNNTSQGVKIVEITDLNKTMTYLMSRFGMRFINSDPETGAENEKGPPAHVMTHILGGLHDMRLPEIDRVSRVPVFSRDGVLITEKGYNPHLKSWYDPGETEFLDVPDKVTDADVDKAIAILDEPKRDFPFSDAFYSVDPEPLRIEGDVDEDGFPLPNYNRGKGSRANYDAMVIQPFVRNMITSACPQYHIDKSAAGTGAGYLVDAAWIIAEGGERAEVKTLPHDDGMIKSMITSGLRGGKSILFLDNVQEQVNSPDLAAALTAGSWSDRLFRTHDEVVIPIRCTWIMAGNRIKFNRDMMRRNVPIFMNAETPNPASDRPVTFYKHQQLHKYVQDNRTQLVWAIHVLVKNWVQKGMPPPVKSPIMQSFNEWSIVLGGILEAAGIDGFLSNIQMYLTSRNDDTTVANNFAERVWKKFGEDLQRAVDILSACEVEGGSGGLLSLNKGNEINLDPALDLPIQPRSATVMARDLAKFINEQLLGATTVVNDAGGLIRVTWVRKTVDNSFRFGLQKLPD